MRIKRGSIAFHNVLKMTDTCKEGHWESMVLLMRNFVIQNGLYTNAPAFYQVADIKGEPERIEYSVYVPICSKIELDAEIPLEFIDELIFEDALMFRVVDPDTPLEETYFLLDACAKDRGYELKRPFYHVCFDVFNEPMTDVIAPIAQRQKDV